MTCTQIRNIAFVGQSGVGKTQLIERLVNFAHVGKSPALGAKSEAVTDFDFQSKKYGHTIESSPFSLTWQNSQINLLDTPGNNELIGRSVSILPAVESCALVLACGEEIGQLSLFLQQLAQQRHKCQLIVVNQIDKQPDDIVPLMAKIQQQLGAHCLPINLPSMDGQATYDAYFAPELKNMSALGRVSEAHDALVDQVVELDEALMEQYLEQGSSLSPAQLHDPFECALRGNHIIPVVFTSAETCAGIEQLLNVLATIMPMPHEANLPLLVQEHDKFPVNYDERGHFIGHVFKVSSDPYLGKMAYVRVLQGTLSLGMSVYLGDNGRALKINQLYRVQGSERQAITAAVAGDICLLTKLQELNYNAIIHDSHDEDRVSMQMIELPAAMHHLAISANKRGEEQKLCDALLKICSEDPSLNLQHRPQSNELVFAGLGPFHTSIALEKMVNVYQLEITASIPTTQFLETITKEATATYRHKKQSGGAGQFGEVSLTVKPLARGEGYRFINKVVGGAIPTSLIPAVEKGVRQGLHQGVLSGNPIQDIEVTLLDGKHHDVDSKEIAFIIAGKKALLAAVQQASPTLLEPIDKLYIEVPLLAMGDVSGDLAARRGLIVDTQQGALGGICLQALVPCHELGDFAAQLKALTSGEGRYRATYSHYEPAPASLQQQVCDAEQLG